MDVNTLQPAKRHASAQMHHAAQPCHATPARQAEASGSENAAPFPLLSLPEGVLAQHVWPHLGPWARAQLRGTCRELRAVADAALDTCLRVAFDTGDLQVHHTMVTRHQAGRSKAKAGSGQPPGDGPMPELAHTPAAYRALDAKRRAKQRREHAASGTGPVAAAADLAAVCSLLQRAPQITELHLTFTSQISEEHLAECKAVLLRYIQQLGAAAGGRIRSLRFGAWSLLSTDVASLRPGLLPPRLLQTLCQCFPALQSLHVNMAMRGGRANEMPAAIASLPHTLTNFLISPIRASEHVAALNTATQLSGLQDLSFKSQSSLSEMPPLVTIATALTRLSFKGRDLATYLPQILARHGPSLRSLSLPMTRSWHALAMLTPEALPELTHLSLTSGCWARDIPGACATLAGLSSLRSLSTCADLFACDSELQPGCLTQLTALKCTPKGLPKVLSPGCTLHLHNAINLWGYGVGDEDANSLAQLLATLTERPVITGGISEVSQEAELPQMPGYCMSLGGASGIRNPIYTPLLQQAYGFEVGWGQLPGDDGVGSWLQAAAAADEWSQEQQAGLAALSNIKLLHLNNQPALTLLRPLGKLLARGALPSLQRVVIYSLQKFRDLASVEPSTLRALQEAAPGRLRLQLFVCGSWQLHYARKALRAWRAAVDDPAAVDLI